MGMIILLRKRDGREACKFFWDYCALAPLKRDGERQCGGTANDNKRKQTEKGGTVPPGMPSWVALVGDMTLHGQRDGYLLKSGLVQRGVVNEASEHHTVSTPEAPIRWHVPPENSGWGVVPLWDACHEK